MPCRFNAKTEQELTNLKPDGFYPGKIVGSKEITHTNGKDYAIIDIDFYDKNGKFHITLWLEYTETWEWLRKHLLDSAGKGDNWQNNEFDARNNALRGWVVYAKIITNKNNYNAVKDFLPQEEGIHQTKNIPFHNNQPTQPVMQQTQQSHAGFDDDVPF